MKLICLSSEAHQLEKLKAFCSTSISSLLPRTITVPLCYSLSSSRPRSMRSSPLQPIFVSSSARHVTTWRIFLNLVHNRCTIAHICGCVWILQSGWSSIASAVSKSIANIQWNVLGFEQEEKMERIWEQWGAVEGQLISVWYQTSILPLFTPDL